MSALLELDDAAKDDLREAFADEAKADKDPKVEAAEPKRSLGYRIFKASRFYVVLALIVGAVLFTGLSASVVKTGSMRPTYQPGDMVITVNPDIVKPGLGKVIVATPPVAGQDLPAIAHRVVAIEPNGDFKTKGDYNPEPDAWQDRPSDVDKVVIAHVPMNWVKNPLVIAGGIGALALIFMWPSSKKEDEDAADESAEVSTGAGPDVGGEASDRV